MMTNNKLIGRLVAEKALKTPKIIEAFQKIDRSDFVLLIHKDEAYEDYPLPISREATISQPTVVAIMLELLKPKEGEKILDIGSGSGWTTALLAQLVGKTGKVIGLEINPKLVEFSKENLKKYEFGWAQITQAKKNRLGLPKAKPFDKILVSAAAKNFPKELLKQLKSGGRLVVPVKTSVWLVTKSKKGKIAKKEFPDFYFVPLL